MINEKKNMNVSVEPKPATNSKTKPILCTRIIALDLDNACASSSLTCEVVANIASIITNQISYADGDKVTIATTHHSAHSLFGWSTTCLRLIRSGKDGCDLALIEQLEALPPTSIQKEVILISGDGIFTDIVGKLQRKGYTVRVLARRGSLSNRLRLAANYFEYLDEPHANFDEIA